MATPYIYVFGSEKTDGDPRRTDILGGKGINLCVMSLAKFPVPSGFVVGTEAYKRFVEVNKLDARIRELAGSLNPADSKGADVISARIRALFKESAVPKDMAETIRAAYRRLQSEGGDRVAVRSSATAEDLAEASFAGQQDTYLNIRGEEALMQAVQSCWGSLWTTRAMIYRSQHDVSIEGLALAVVVQQMVLAEYAGIMFTANPVTGARDEIVINAAWGLGEAIVGGHVTPDTVVADKATGKPRSVTVSDKRVMTARTETGTEEREVPEARRKERVLDDGAAEKLAGIGRSVEAHYGSPQDIEWAYANGKFYLVQARPITALPDDPKAVETYRQQEIARLRQIASGRRRVWVRHNLDEIMPSPTPLTWDIVKEFMSGDGGFGRMYKDFGYQPSPEVCRDGFLELIGGTVYADPERAARLFWPEMPLAYDMEAVSKDPKLMDAAPGKFVPENADAHFLFNLPRLLRQMRRCSKNMKAMGAETVEHFEKDVVPPFIAWVKQCRAMDLSRMATAGVLQELRERIRRGLNDIGCESLKPGFFGGMAQADLEGRLSQLMGPTEARNLALLLTQGLENDSTIEQNQALFMLAKGEGTRKGFLETYGHRGVGEMELARPPWREDDSYIQQVLSSFLGDNVVSPAARHEENAAKRREAEALLLETLRKWGGSSYYEEIVDAMREAQKKLPYREGGKNYLIMGYDTIRLVITELGRRWKLAGDVFFLTLKEIGEYESAPARFKDVIARRKAEWQLGKRLDMSDVVDTDNLDALGLPRQYDDTSELKGDPIASGVSVGQAMIVFDPQEVASNCTDYILVCPSTDPSWTALFVHARGLVVEQGGILSHGAIVARDFGIPAVVCPDATRRIPANQQIRVDGNRGVITLLEGDSSHA